MSRVALQWAVWAVLMAVFSALTLAGRWLDLTLALTISAVIWYGIVPPPSSSDNNSDTVKSR